MFKRSVLLWIGASIGSSLFAQSAAKVDFKRDVQPIFQANCYGCHGANQQMHGFRLDRRSDAMKGGTLAMIGPGNAEGSRLYLRLTGSQFGMQMPPTGALKPAQVDTIKAWINQGAVWPDDASGEKPPTAADARATKLIQLLRAGDEPGFKKALAADAGAAKLPGSKGATPLMYAAIYGDVSDMTLLLEKGADPNAHNDAGATALMWAVDDLEKTKLLVEHGANVNAKSDDGRTPLMIAAGVFHNSPVIQLLLDKGAKATVSAPVIFGDTTPLTEAAMEGDPENFKLIAAHGADLQSSGALALALSMRARCDSCVGAFLKKPDPATIIPAMFFVSPPLGPAFGVQPLVEAGADANAKDPAGNSIIAQAAASDAMPVDAIKALIAHGADVNGTTKDGETALQLARRNGASTPVVDLLLKAGARDTAEPAGPSFKTKAAASPRAAVERAMPLLQSNDATFLHKSGCVSCHNNTLTAVTIATARKNGIKIDEKEVQDQLKTISTYLDSWRERVLQNEGIPGDSDTIGYILNGLSASGFPANESTDAMARFIRRQQLPDGHWASLGTRPPLESSDIQVTAVSMRALQAYAPKMKKAAYDKSVAAAAAWIAKAESHTTEDRTYQLLGLMWSNADKQLIHKAAAALLGEQREDGGWSQLPTLKSDAYATGEALTALQQTGELTAVQAAGKRAVQFLLNSQAEDGSWYVKHRVVPIQPYFESGFPYGRDQFISASATNWATTALALASKQEPKP